MTKIDNLQTLQELEAELERQQLQEMINKWEEEDFNPDSLLDEFVLTFFDKNVLYKEVSFPIGTFSTYALNFVIDGKMKELQPLLQNLYKDFQTLAENTHKKLQLDDLKKFDAQIEIIKPYLTSLILFDDRIKANNTLQTTYEVYGENADDLILNHTTYQVLSYIKIGDALISFFEHMHPFSKRWITDSSKSYNHNYAQAFQDYFYHDIPLNVAINTNTILPTVMFQFTQVESWFQPLTLPNQDHLVFGESLKFNSYLELLQYDYFKALQNEHTVRICSNCKRAFLNTTKHHTIYCDQIAPNETDKTCRDVGALNKQKEKVENSPIHQLYKKCYKKLNQRYNRQTITLDEFNRLIAEIVELRESALIGNLSITELESKLSEL